MFNQLFVHSEALTRQLSAPNDCVVGCLFDLVVA
jgi:hypothetical protein